MRVSKFVEPDINGSKDDSAPEGEGELVVSGGEPAPLFEYIERTADDVPAFVGILVQADGSAPLLPLDFGGLLIVPD